MSDFIIQSEGFQMGILDKAPVADQDECILLYREEQGENGSILINSNRVQAAKIRRGKFNKKVTFSLAEKRTDYSANIEIKDYDFHFEVKISTEYSLENVRVYYFGGKIEDETAIKQTIRQVLKNCDGVWSIKEKNNLKTYLEDELEKQLSRFKSLYIKVQEISVALDKEAEKIIQSDKEKTVNVHTYKNDTDLKIVYNEQDGRAEESQAQLTKQKMKQMADMMQQFGAMAPIVVEYLGGQISGKEFYDYIMKNKMYDFDILSKARENDLITEQELTNQVEKLLRENKYIDTQEIKTHQNEQLDEKREEIDYTEKEYSLADGDYL